MPFVEKAGRTFIATVMVAGSFSGFGCNKPGIERSVQKPGKSVGQLKPQDQLAKFIPDLGLNIDEAGFWQAIKQGPRVGIITRTWEKDKMDCLRPPGDFCVAAPSLSFRVGINQPMVDFIAARAKFINPYLPTRMVFTEEWLGQPGNREQTAAFVAISDDQKDQIIVVSLKASAYLAFKDLDRRRISLNYFNGAVSFFVSSFAVREFADAGARTRTLGRTSQLVPPREEILTQTRPQLEKFYDRYVELYDQALQRGSGDAALLFIVNPEDALVDLLGYREKIYREFRQLGIEHLRVN